MKNAEMEEKRCRSKEGEKKGEKKHTNGQTEPDGEMGTSEKDWGQGAAAESELVNCP